MFFRTPIVAVADDGNRRNLRPAGLLFREFNAEALAGGDDGVRRESAIRARQLADPRAGGIREPVSTVCAIGARLLDLVRELEQL